MTATAALALVVLLYAGLLGLWAAGAAVLRRPRGPAHTVGLVLLEVLLVTQAALRGVDLLGDGPAPAEPGVHVGYLGASVVLLPLLLALARPDRAATPTRREAAWYSAAVAVACAAVVVVDVRLVATGAPLRGVSR